MVTIRCYVWAMKAWLRGGFLLLALVSGLVQDSHAARSRRGSTQIRRAPLVQNTNLPSPAATNAATRLAKPAEQPQHFRDLPLNTVFYAWTDRERKYNPWVKISASSARAQGDPAASGGKVVQVSPDLWVLAAKGSSKKADQPAPAPSGVPKSDAHKSGVPGREPTVSAPP